MTSKIKQYSSEEESMFDLLTYMGRLKHFSKMTDIRLIFLANNKLEKYLDMIQDFNNNPNKYDLKNTEINKQLWEARYGMRSAINSETGKIIPVYARMCAFVPCNIPIAFGLICLPVTRFNILSFNILNQSYNALMNYSNSSGTDDSIKFVAISYALALTSSVGIGLLLKSRFSRNSAQNLGLFKEVLIRFLPSCMAGFLNIFFMRSDYFLKGINVKDEKGNILGTSRISGAKAVIEGGLTRFILPLPLIANHFILKRVNQYPLNKKIKVGLELILCALALGFGLPCSIALFKENSKLGVNWLEKEIQEKARQQGIYYLIYNKGL